ncbi:MAG: amino acid ABC transporter substrate-binding protein [Cyclobacteriaceae bacterium]
MRSLFITLCLITIPLFMWGQGSQAEYLEAKRLFNDGKYTSAKGAFGALTEDPNFGTYSSFYFALSAYYQGDVKLASDMWNQILSKSPKWKGKSEVLFWLAYTNLEAGDLNKGISHAESLSKVLGSEDVEQNLYENLLGKSSIDKIEEAYSANTSNRNLAYIYTKKLLQEPYETRNFGLINQLRKKWDFEKNQLSLDDLPDLKKDSYRVGVVLPFMYDEEKPEWVIQNKVVMDLYQGMQLAAQDLDSLGIKLELFPVDTKRSKEQTTETLEQLPDSFLDLIVGPLYAEPINAAKQFSFENKVNMINPVSSNQEVIADNPYAFLFKPTYETMAKALAKKTISEVSNKNAMIFYENNTKDSLFAATYKKEIEEAGFNVVWYKELTKENAKNVLDTLIDSYLVYYTKAEADSINELSQRYVKERRVRKDELKRIQRFKDGKAEWDSLFHMPITIREEDQKEVTYYEKLLNMEADSLGHVLGATRKNFMANNLISAVETFGDSTLLLGYGEWLDFTMIAYNQLQRINVTMVDPDFTDIYDPSYDLMESRFLQEFSTLPSKYHLLGYELIMSSGKLMDSYGVYFQKELRKGSYFEGEICEGLKYGSQNDNQIVPIIRFEDAQLKVVNKEFYED